MKITLALTAGAALCSGCTGLTAAQTPRSQPPALFEAAGEHWRFTLFATGVRYVTDRPFRDYWGAPPARRDDPPASTLSGEVSRDIVIGGLAEEDLIAYSLEVVPGACRGPGGRIYPSAVRMIFSADYGVAGCGSALPSPTLNAAR